MKKSILYILKKIILAVALFSANSVSQLGMYQVACPKELKNKECI